MDTNNDSSMVKCGCESGLGDIGSRVRFIGNSFHEAAGLEEIVCDEGRSDHFVLDDRQSNPDERGVTPTGSQDQCHLNTMEIFGTVENSYQLSVVSDVDEPKVGMLFQNWLDMEAFYKEYAERKGFGVSRVQVVFSKGVIRIRTAMTWRCECWGTPNMRAVREAKKRAKAMGVSGCGGVVSGKVCDVELNRRKRKSKKCECGAMLYGSVNQEKEWVVRKVVLKYHNHNPIPSQSQLVKEYRMKQLTPRVRRNILKYYDEGVPMKQIHACMDLGCNGSGNSTLTVKDLNHEVYKERGLKMVGGDAAAMLGYFEKMQATTTNFYHVQRVDDHGRFKDVFWVDGRSRAAYAEFGDVVCFDATYLTNEYDLPFLNFVGVNHQGQSLLLGCALILCEDCDNFLWIFRQWLSSMEN
ncbi:protein FAR1-RELATED SEQUENCE 3-like [Chenopodium quinoa]|uniref:protein FAR1-RELATED SEQUENCE 3-like n=1 Tax=Chenopodium quinoa TaxID=63459 RepID=UPI000B780F86|nr:protein FAR1-RELATED SEQUENCE 3-like [Chenopodium quinoa]